MSGNVTDIKDVPKSPNTGFGQKAVYNPLPEDFTHSFNGTPYTILAGTSEGFPEFLAYHLAKHLAQKIVSRKWEIQIKKDAVGQISPDTAKAIPLIEVQQMMEALLLGREAFEKIGGVVSEPVKIETFSTPEYLPEQPKPEPIVEPKTELTPETPKAVNPLSCPTCGLVAKTKAGLSSHRRIKKH